MSFERENIHKMRGYASGEQPEDPRTIKLNTNENPYPPSPAVDAVIANFSRASLRRYPQPTASRFCELAARLHGVDRANVIATRGGDELLRLVITTFVAPGEKIGMTDPTYSLYPVLAQIQDCPIVTIDLESQWSLPEDFASQLNRAGVKLTFLVNPHAPSGTMLSTEQVSRLAEDLDNLLLLDEAYIDFAGQPDQCSELIARHKNLIILRTLSKGYSLAGLRFGYGLGDASLIEPMMTKTRDSYNLDALSQEIAAAAIIDQDYVRKTCGLVMDERERLQQVLMNLGFDSPPSHANFLLVTVPDTASETAANTAPDNEKAARSRCAKKLYQFLKERHILVRYFDLPRLDDKLRISIGSPEENEALLILVRNYLETSR